jgi:sRNA-binding carbon storage regulator CsrA
MLSLNRKTKQKIVIADKERPEVVIEITILNIYLSSARFGIKAPKVTIHTRIKKDEQAGQVL